MPNGTLIHWFPATFQKKKILGLNKDHPTVHGYLRILKQRVFFLFKIGSSHVRDARSGTCHRTGTRPEGTLQRRPLRPVGRRPDRRRIESRSA